MLCHLCKKSSARTSIGESTCKECGEQLAQTEIQRKKGDVGVAYNKGGYQYLGSTKGVDTLDARRQLFSNIADVSLEPKIRLPVKKRKAIGLLYLTVEDRLNNQPVSFFAADDKRIATAHRVVYW